MNMQPSFGLFDLLVFGAVAFAVLFTIAWALSPKLREWIEQPKFRFQENLRFHNNVNHDNVDKEEKLR
jgi:hypothetical protein